MRDLGRGVVFEDHVCRELYRAGLPLQVYRSRDGQKLWGESTLGLEVKLDENFRETGNLFIETEERPTTAQGWKPAGIYSVPPPWLYGIGDFFTLYLLATSFLRIAHERSKQFRRVENKTQTGRGFLLPVDTATKWAAHILEVEV
jgi:hypothetical protein